MDFSQSVTILIFIVILYIFIVDSNVSDYFLLVFKLTKLNIERSLWMIRFHPKNPITNFLKEREYTKLAKELHKEMMKK